MATCLGYDGLDSRDAGSYWLWENTLTYRIGGEEWPVDPNTEAEWLTETAGMDECSPELRVHLLQLSEALCGLQVTGHLEILGQRLRRELIAAGGKTA